MMRPPDPGAREASIEKGPSRRVRRWGSRRMADVAARQRKLVLYLPHRQPVWRLPAGYVEAIRRRAGKSFEIEIPMDEEAFLRGLPGAEILFAWGLARRHIDKAGPLRWLHTPLAGVDRVLNPELVRSPIRVTSSRGVNSIAVAEHTLGLILALSRGIADGVRAQGEKRWAQPELFGRQPPLDELHGKLLGILGLGVAEPMPSWGSLLKELEGLVSVGEEPWKFVPLILLVLVVTSFQFLLSRQEEVAA